MATTSNMHSAAGTGAPVIDQTKALMICGIVAGPVFALGSLIQAIARTGFSLQRHVISMLLLGEGGWVQVVNFVASGLLVVAYAVGLRRLLHGSRGGTWGPLLVGAYGVGMVTAGLVAPDAGFGFPPGTPEGMPVMSAHGGVHNLAFFVVVISLVAAGFVFARRFAAARERSWAAYCAATAVAAPALVVMGAALTASGNGGLPLLGLLFLMSVWISLIAARLLAESVAAVRSKPQFA